MSTPDSPDPKHPLPQSMRTRKPWPMWPIGLAIVLFIAVYTWVNLEFRKDGQAYEPFQAMMDRKSAIVEKNFYDWYSLKTTRADSLSALGLLATSASQAYPNVLDEVIPEQLKYYMASRPVLIPGFIKTESPSQLTPGEPLPIRLHVPANLARDERLHLLSFYKKGQLFILATLFVEEEEDFDDSLLAGETSSAEFLIPTEPMAAPTITVSFLNKDRLATWKVENLDPDAPAK